MFVRISFSISVFSLVALPLTFAADASSEARALFAGVKQRLQKYECFRVCYTETRQETNQTVSQVVDYDHGQMRKEHLRNDDGFAGWIAVLNGDACCSFRFVPTEHAKLDSPKSTNAMLSGLYDPRILCLGDVPIYGLTIDKRLPLPSAILPDVHIEDVSVDGLRVRKIEMLKQSDNAKAKWEFWISEPEFYMLKVKCETSTQRFETTSKYSDPNLGPFPSEIHIFREVDGRIKADRTIKVTSFEMKECFPPETFTYTGMNLPLNTAVVDYRIQRRLGYWNGEELVDRPVGISAQELRELMAEIEKKDVMPLHRIIGIGIGIVMILLVIYLHMRSKRK
jgi:hypothetical protein